MVATYIPSEFFVENPNFRTRTEIIDSKIQKARQKVGLKPQNDDIKITENDPGLAYYKTPKYRSQTELIKQKSGKRPRE